MKHRDMRQWGTDLDLLLLLRGLLCLGLDPFLQVLEAAGDNRDMAGYGVSAQDCFR